MKMSREWNFFSVDRQLPIVCDYLTEQDISAVASTGKVMRSDFRPIDFMVNKFLLQVMHDEQDKAQRILKIHPELLTIEGRAIDYSGREFTTTAFVFVLWALNIRNMAHMMLDCIPYNEKGNAIAQTLLSSYEVHAKQGLGYKLNGELIQEVHFNLYPFKKALSTCINLYEEYEAGIYASCPSNELSAQWINGVGHAQRYFPAHVARYYCEPDSPSLELEEIREAFGSSLIFYNYSVSPYCYEYWYGSNLGIHVGIFNVGESVGDRCKNVGSARISTFRRDLKAITALGEMNAADYLLFKQRLINRVQQPDIISSTSVLSV